MMLGIFNFKTTFGCVSVPDGSIVASTGKCLETVVKPFIEGRFEGWGRSGRIPADGNRIFV